MDPFVPGLVQNEEDGTNKRLRCHWTSEKSVQNRKSFSDSEESKTMTKEGAEAAAVKHMEQAKKDEATKKKRTNIGNCYRRSLWFKVWGRGIKGYTYVFKLQKDKPRK
jgi:hypothetical protein